MAISEYISRQYVNSISCRFFNGDGLGGWSMSNQVTIQDFVFVDLLIVLQALTKVKKRVNLLACSARTIRWMTLLCLALRGFLMCTWIGGVAMCLYHGLGIICKSGLGGRVTKLCLICDHLCIVCIELLEFWWIMHHAIVVLSKSNWKVYSWFVC